MNLGYHHKGGLLRDMGNDNIWSVTNHVGEFIPRQADLHELEACCQNAHRNGSSDYGSFASDLSHDIWKSGDDSPKAEFNKAPGAPIRRKDERFMTPNHLHQNHQLHPTTNGYSQSSKMEISIN